MSALGLILLFAAFGPAVGGVVFLPLAIMLEAPLTILHLGWIAGLLGHALALIPAYIVGLGPAAATGLLYALWDAFAPTSWPRALTAAAIGAAMTHAVIVWLASLGGAVETSVTATVSPDAERWIDAIFSGRVQRGAATRIRGQRRGRGVRLLDHRGAVRLDDEGGSRGCLARIATFRHSPYPVCVEADART